MRVFFITSKLNFKTAGGSVMDLHLKALGLVELGHQVSVVTAFSQSNIINMPLPYTVYERHTKSGTLWGLQKSVYAILKEFESRADVFYIDGHMFLYGGGFYRLMGGEVPVVAFFNVRLNCLADTQGNVSSVSFFKKIKKGIRFLIEQRFGIFIAKHLDAFIFNTPMLEKLYLDFGFSKEKNYIVEDFVSTKEITNRCGITPDKLENKQKNSKTITLFSTGRMMKEKGFDLIIKAFEKVKNKDKYRVVISGGGPDKERLEKMVEGLGLKKYFEFPGWVEKSKLNELFFNANVFIFPKWWIEYGSAVLTEAMAYGLPCIVPAGGALEWLTAGAAPTFKNDDFCELAERIEELSNSTELRVNLAKKILSVAEKLDYKKLSLKLEEVVKFAVSK